MRKNLLFIIVLLLIICGCRNKEVNNHIIHYEDNMNTYDIRESKNKLEIDKSDIIICVKAPCDAINKKTYTKDNTKEYKQLIKELFKDKDNNEISITDKDLTDKQKDIIYEILDKEKEVQYKVTNTDYYNSNYVDKGYYVDTKDNKTIVTVTSGQHSTGGYDIKVVKVSIKDKKAYIYVDEISPNPKDIVTEAFTYPTITIEFDNILDEIFVANVNTNQEYEKKSN